MAPSLFLDTFFQLPSADEEPEVALPEDRDALGGRPSIMLGMRCCCGCGQMTRGAVAIVGVPQTYPQAGRRDIVVMQKGAAAEVDRLQIRASACRTWVFFAIIAGFPDL